MSPQLVPPKGRVLQSLLRRVSPGLSRWYSPSQILRVFWTHRQSWNFLRWFHGGILISITKVCIPKPTLGAVRCGCCSFLSSERTLLQVNNNGSGGRLWVPASPTAITGATHTQPVILEDKGGRRRCDGRHIRWPCQQAPSSRMSSDNLSTTGSVDSIM